MIKENLLNVEERIQQACERANRQRDEVTLIAVSKTKPVSMLKEAEALGTTEFGENKVQEIMDKVPNFGNEIHWHMIGHLQRNKVKYIIDKVSLIHSVDSIRLARQIDEEAKKHNLVMNILVQVNIAREESKFGIDETEVFEFLRELSEMSNVKVKGLMTIAPFVENSEDNREYFRKMRNLYVDIKSKNIDNIDMEILSMGMTGDYEVAIEEGATMIRVGTGIFGERNYNV